MKYKPVSNVLLDEMFEARRETRAAKIAENV